MAHLERHFTTSAGQRIAYVATPRVGRQRRLLATNYCSPCTPLYNHRAKFTGMITSVLRASGALQPYAIVSHSCGCVIAMALIAAGLRPQRLALVAAPYPSPRYPVRQELLTHARDRLMLA